MSWYFVQLYVRFIDGSIESLNISQLTLNKLQSTQKLRISAIKFDSPNKESIRLIIIWQMTKCQGWYNALLFEQIGIYQEEDLDAMCMGSMRVGLRQSLNK